MESDGSEGRDDRGSGYSRKEESGERLDRHWNEMLQELRLAQTGTQVMFAFLLTIGFTQPFRDSDVFTHRVYAATVVVMAVAMALFLAPVALHRMVFGDGVRDEMIPVAGRLIHAGLACLLLGVTGGVLLALDAALPLTPALVLTGIIALDTALLWYTLPALLRRRR